MTSAPARPLLFLDVDGPLIPFGSSPDRAQASVTAPADGHPLLDRLVPGIGRRLRALGCDLVWATTWGEDANAIVAPLIGLPRLPVVPWPADGGVAGPRGLHWKTPHLVEWAARRPFIWVDDEIGDMDRLWVAARHPGPSLLRHVAPARGLSDADFSALASRLDSWGSA
ncbi:HAD domain-containing protein [Streptomyces sp. NPDC096191]|uniref:HAD domain-containing protein n=1 Tax=Streptomyces sp. NPDC096191 TaxID=3155426 RepID=UPI00331D0F23